jgi:flagellar hook-basal body complex protein FliE
MRTVQSSKTEEKLHNEEEAEQGLSHNEFIKSLKSLQSDYPKFSELLKNLIDEIEKLQKQARESELNKHRQT